MAALLTDRTADRVEFPMRNKWLPRTRSEEGEWQINNTLLSLVLALGFAILIGGLGHLFAISY